MRKAQTKRILCLAILLATSVRAFALDPSLDVSQYAHTAWKIRDGFTKGTIFSMEQTPDGYLWLSTEFGLVRFDGVQAVPWQPPAGEQLPSNLIQDLLVARDGTLWISTLKGLASWKNGELKQHPEVAGRWAGRLLQDEKGTVWVGLQQPGGLCAIQAGTVKCFGSGSFGNVVSALYADHKGNLWVSAQTGLWRWEPGHPELFRLPAEVEARAIIEGDNGALLMATMYPGNALTASLDGLKQFEGGQFRDYKPSGIAGKVTPTCLLRSSDGSLWIGTVRGLLHLHRGKIDRFNDLSGEVVTKIFEDREGNIWVSTEDGLDRFREFSVPTISANEGLSHSAVHVVQATPDGSVWIATADGLSRWQSGHMTIYGRQSVPYQNKQTDTLDVAGAEVANSGLQGAVFSLGQDDRGRLWAASHEGVFYFDGTRFMRVPGVRGGTIFSIAGDAQGKVWISDLDQGLLYVTPAGAVQRIPWTRFGHNYAVALLPDRFQGGLWAGFFDGGVSYLRDGQVRAFYIEANGLGKGRVSDLQLGSDGAVWAATEGGLSRIKDGQVTTLTSKNGLPCDDVHWVMEDNDHSFWLNQPCGLVRIARSELNAWMSDPKRSVHVTVFDGSDGVRARFSAGRYGPKVTQAIDGKIWFTPLDGVSIIDPLRLPFNKLPPPVYIQQITADDKKYDPSSGLRLPPNVRDLTLDYTALSLTVPEKVHFRFQLDGQDKDWREVVNVRHVQYSNLPPGIYRFRVTACNNSGVWNEQGTYLDFAIAPAYYQTNWFRALCLISFVTVLWIVYQLRVRALKQRQALLEQNQKLLEQHRELLERDKGSLEQHQTEIRALNEELIQAQEAERMRIAGELHDGVLQQITSLTLRLGKVKRQVPPDSDATATVSGLQQQLIKIGTDIRHLSHELHPVLLQEAGLPAALSAYCEEFSSVRGLSVSCVTDESVKELSPAAALCIYRIAQEALGNAAKHSAAKKAQVRLTQSDGRVSLVVSDDGIGCASEQIRKSRGLGLINMRERVLQLDGTFAFDSEPGRGTTVIATVPFDRPGRSDSGKPPQED